MKVSCHSSKTAASSETRRRVKGTTLPMKHASARDNIIDVTKKNVTTKQSRAEEPNYQTAIDERHVMEV